MGAQEEIAKHPLPAPAFWAAVAFAAGIFVAGLTTNHLFFWFVFSALWGFCAAFFHLRSNHVVANLSLFVLLSGLGGLRYSASTGVVAGRSVASFAGLDKRMVISGRICELPDIKSDRTRIYLDQIRVGWKSKIELAGRVRLSIGRPVSSFAMGDQIEFIGFLDSLWRPANPGALDFARLMQIRNVQGAVFLKDAKGVSLSARSPGSWRGRLAGVRDFVEKKLTEGLPPKEAGVVQGFVLGNTRNIEPSTYDLFRKTGTLHLLAVSGANVAWVALLPILLLKLLQFPLRWRYWAALGAVWVFVLLTDLQASVLRAAIMFTVWTASKIMYREISGLQSLGLSGSILLTINPLWFFDIGFELSFLAVFALIFTFSEQKTGTNRFVRYLNWTFLNNFRSSVAVFLLITPLLAYYFNQVAWAALLVNVFAIPLTALITWSTLFRLGSGFLEYSNPLVLVQEELFDWLFRVQHFFANLPDIFIRVPHPNGVETFLLSVVGFGLLLIFFKPQYKKASLYLFLLGLTPLVWSWGLKRAPEFSLSVLEAKGEMTAVLSLPGRTIGIGGGELRETEDTPQQVLEPFLAYLGKEKLDGYLPLRLDSTGQAASAEIVGNRRPNFTGWPVGGRQKVEDTYSRDLVCEYLRVIGDTTPFALRLTKGSTTFLFVPEIKNFRPPQWDSLLAGSTVLIAPLEFPQAEGLSAQASLKAVVSTRREFQSPPILPDNLFFTFKDGAVTFRENKGSWRAWSFLSRRTLAFDNR